MSSLWRKKKKKSQDCLNKHAQTIGKPELLGGSGIDFKTHPQMIWCVLGPWHSWGGQKDLRLYLKIRSPDL
jgi:hypothetical protein